MEANREANREANTPFERILVGIDENGLASNAALRGLELADRLDAKVEFVHGVDVPPALWPGLTRQELATIHAASMVSARTKTLAALAEPLQQAGIAEEKVANRLTLFPGHAVKALLRRGEELEADLFVIGPHAERKVFDFGSTSRAVLSRTTVPVWNQIGPPRPIARILVATDFSEHSKKAMTVARDLAARLGASVNLMHCWLAPAFAYGNVGDSMAGPTYVVDQEREAAREELDTVARELDWGFVEHETTFIEGVTADRILEQAEEADLIVMGTHGRTGLSRFLIGSVAYAVLRRTAKPVLVVPDPGRTWLLSDAGVAADEIVPKGAPAFG